MHYILVFTKTQDSITSFLDLHKTKHPADFRFPPLSHHSVTDRQKVNTIRTRQSATEYLDGDLRPVPLPNSDRPVPGSHFYSKRSAFNKPTHA